MTTPPRSSHGFTLIEVLVALVILNIGAWSIWYTYRTAEKLAIINFRHNTAVRLAQNDLELVRLLPRKNVRDTTYQCLVPPGMRFQVVRHVLDSAELEERLDLDLDLAAPRALQKPLEMQVKVKVLKSEWDMESEETKAIVKMSTLKPDYAWY